MRDIQIIVDSTVDEMRRYTLRNLSWEVVAEDVSERVAIGGLVRTKRNEIWRYTFAESYRLLQPGTLKCYPFLVRIFARGERPQTIFLRKRSSQ
jgi:hypothetical protein